MTTDKRLADFIREQIEPILKNWEEFAKTILHADHLGKSGLRDHASDMLLEIADDLGAKQSKTEQAAKSKGRAPEDEDESSAEVHGAERHATGFSVMETVSEFRALRASVVSLWTRTYPEIAGTQLEDLTRFHEAIDQAVAESLEQYAALKETETRLFEAVLFASPDPIYVLSLDGSFVYANKASADLFAIQSESIIGKTLLDIEFPFASELQNNLQTVVAERSIYRGKFLHTLASGEERIFEYLLAPVLNEEHDLEATVCIARDITQQALAEEQVWHSAHHDHLTGLPNRRLFLDRLAQEVKHAKRGSQPLSVLFMDLDGFKQVNDCFGHEAGDLLLCAVAERLTECVREEDTVARLGGDEFTVIITGAEHRRDVEHVARNIKAALEMPFEIAQRSVQIYVSIGASYYPRDGANPVALLKAADQVMYKVKNAASERIFS